MTPRELTNEIVKILDKKKALDITAIKTDELTIVSDYFVIATGTSRASPTTSNTRWASSALRPST